eukprot:m.102193 g.102193  ORF g.102193 m.102193 type:complete len:114 (+) comp12533_c0_seq3:1706-2047(+)
MRIRCVCLDDSRQLKHGVMRRFVTLQQDLLNFGDQGSHHWASVSIPSLRKALRYVWRPDRRAVVKTIGKRARQRVTKYFSREAVAEKVMQRLRAVQEALSSESLRPGKDKKSL